MKTSARAPEETTPPPRCASSRESKQLEREMWFAEKIAEASGEPFCGIFAGTTDSATRARRTRELILAHMPAARRVVPNRSDNFAECYARLYGEPLSTPTTSDPALFSQQPELSL